MGGGTFGAAAAADYYFGKNLKDITLPEAAMLAGLFWHSSQSARNASLTLRSSERSFDRNRFLASCWVSDEDSLRVDEFPDILVKALISTEDRRFYEHWGIDPIGARAPGTPR
jgi:membrane peptidoglycan carboxypeptidase